MGALSFMTQVSAGVYLFRPEEQSALSFDSSAPQLIIVLGWLSARETHLAKFVLKYRGMYPGACILLLESRMAITCSSTIARKHVMPSVSAIQSLLEPYRHQASSSDCRLLIHLFSGGGSCLLSTIYDVYKTNASDQQLESGTNVLPMHVTVFDSTPALQFDHRRIIYSILQGIQSELTKSLLRPALYLLGLAWLSRIRLFAAPDDVTLWASAHNDHAIVREACRTYIYSDTDPIVPAQEVQQHANEAEARGFVVKRELFAGSPHVAHAKSDPERYWTIVRQTWERSIPEVKAKL